MSQSNHLPRALLVSNVCLPPQHSGRLYPGMLAALCTRFLFHHSADEDQLLLNFLKSLGEYSVLYRLCALAIL